MTRIAGACALFTTLLAATACGVGGDDGDDMMPPGPGEGSDDRIEKLGIVCESSFKLTGTFTAGTPGRPIDPDTTLPLAGCWPVGTWTFTAAVSENNCPAAPAVIPTYSFRVDRMTAPDGDDLLESYTNLTTVGDLKWHLSVGSNGQGCEASLELGSVDGTKYWHMQPVLPTGANTTIAGQGDFTTYKTDSWPWKM